MGGVSFFRQRATSTGTFSKLQNYIYLYKLLSFRSTEPIWVTLYTYHQSNNDVTLLQSILDKVYNSPSELHLVENWGSVFLSTTHHFHRHLLQATKNITLLLQSVFLRLLYTTCYHLDWTQPIWVTLYTYHQTKLIMMSHSYTNGHYTRQSI